MKDKLPELTEEQFLRQVIDLAHICGYAAAHFRAAMTTHGWRTPVSADGRGFVDLVLAKEGCPVIFAECKRRLGKLTPEQEQWQELLKSVPGIRYFVWRPDDLEAIASELRGEE